MSVLRDSYVNSIYNRHLEKPASNVPIRPPDLHSNSILYTLFDLLAQLNNSETLYLMCKNCPYYVALYLVCITDDTETTWCTIMQMLMKV